MHNPHAETRFVELMTELFQLDEAEALDFGIYRVIRRHNKEVREFLGEITNKGGEKQLQGGTLSHLLESAFTATDHEVIEEAKERKAELESQLGINAKQSHDEREAILAGHNKVPALKAMVQEYRDTLDTLNAQQTGGTDRTEVLNHLYNFFARHYQDGDFIVERRFNKNGSRYIQSRGEDTEFHWATEDMYYIKSGDTFTDYPVTLSNGAKLVFTIEPDTLNDTRASLKPTDKAHYEISSIEKQEDGSHTVALSYLKGAQSDKQKNDIAAAVCQKVKADEAEVKRWLNHFIARNQSDFFIHKKLKEALTSDLDIFIKIEVLNTDQLLELNDLPRRAIQVGRIIKQVGLQIIDFIATLEDFQKQLWEKKKLVFNTRYVITLDRIAKLAGEAWLEQQLPTIIKAQKAEWKALGLGEFKAAEDCKEVIPGDLASEAKTRWLPLPVDTGLLDDDFKWMLLAAVTESAPLDENLDGVAIHSDNWQALNTLQEKYREQVKCIYIDPPYNTGSDGFPYKDSYRHASWIAMINDRLGRSAALLQDNGIIFSSIDENERVSLIAALNNSFGSQNKVEELIWVQDTSRNNSPTYSTAHEYIPAYAKNKPSAEKDPKMFRESKPGYSEIQEIISEAQSETPFPKLIDIEQKIKTLFSEHKRNHISTSLERGESKSEAEKNDPWKGIYNYWHAEYRTLSGEYIPEDKAESANAAIWIYREVEPSMPSGKQSRTTKDPDSPNYRFYTPDNPLTGQPCVHPSRGWAFPENPIEGRKNSFRELQADNRIAFSESNKIPQQKYFLHEVESNVASSVFRQYSNGDKELFDVLKIQGSNLNPKPTGLVSKLISQTCGENDLICDFFAGTGTTAHAILNSNHELGYYRKFLVIEANDYIESIILPRTKCVASCNSWTKGNPDNHRGPGLFMRIQALEQYEDTLENLDTELSQQNAFDFDDPAFSLRYRMNRESKAVYCAIDSYRSPWGYQLKRALGGGEAPSQPVDLVESLIYLLGLKVNQLYREDEGVVITGQDRRSRTVVVFFRDCDHKNSEAWISAKLAAHEAQLLYTNLPAELSCEGSDRLQAIEAVFASQFGRGEL